MVVVAAAAAAATQARTIEGVLEINKEHFWTQDWGEFIGSMHVRCSREANEQQILRRLNELFSSVVRHLTVQVRDLISSLVRWPFGRDQAAHARAHSPMLSKRFKRTTGV